MDPNQDENPPAPFPDTATPSSNVPNIPNLPPQPVQQPVSSTPVKKLRFVKTFAILVLISGIFDLLGSFPFLLLGGLGMSLSFFLLGLVNFVIGILMVILSFGLRKMKKWALYLLIASTALSFVLLSYGLITDFSNQRPIEIIALVIEIGIVGYFWKHNKEFI